MAKTAPLDRALADARQRTQRALGIFQAAAEELEQASAHAASVASKAEELANYHEGIKQAANSQAAAAKSQAAKIRDLLSAEG